MKKIIVLFLIFALEVPAFSQWQQVWNGMGQTRTVTALFQYDTILLAGLVYQGGYANGIYRSTNEGLTWAQTSLNNRDVWHFTSSGSVKYASTSEGIYSSVTANIWTSFALNNKNVYEMAINGSYMYAGTQDDGVYYSTNEGGSWTQSFLNNRSIWALAVLNNFVIAGTYNNGIYYSTDNGYIWNQSSMTGYTVKRIIFHGTTAYACATNGVFRSTNYGASWLPFGLAGKDVNEIQIREPYIYAATIYSGTYILSMQGATLSQINTGFPAGDIDVYSLLFTNNYLLAGTYGKSVWRRSINEIGIEQVSSQMPSAFKLSQNYPNPFNPVTNINFDLPKESSVKLTVYDALGKEVTVLVNQHLGAGSYNADWNASDYPSGIYFYKLEAGSFVETKKMILIK